MSPTDTARGKRGHDNPASGARRSVERTIEIDAPVRDVWRALTDADELMRWFPLEARAEPGEGGSIWMRWADVYGGPRGSTCGSRRRTSGSASLRTVGDPSRPITTSRTDRVGRCCASSPPGSAMGRVGMTSTTGCAAVGPSS